MAAQSEIIRLWGGHPRDWDSSTIAHVKSLAAGLSAQDAKDTYAAMGFSTGGTKDKIVGQFTDRWGLFIKTESSISLFSRERRSLLTSIELREAPGGPTKFVGRPVVYNSWSDMIQGAFREQILPGAFDEHLATGPDIVCSVDHDLHRLLGRTASGTLKIDQRADGLWIEVTDPQTTYSRDLMQCVKRGDVRGMSFMFDCAQDKWHHADGVNSRDVIKASIYEVSFVNFPAYPASTASARSLEAAAANVEPARSVPPATLQLRLREVETEIRFATGDMEAAGIGEIVAVKNALGKSMLYVKLPGGAKWFAESEVFARSEQRAAKFQHGQRVMITGSGDEFDGQTGVVTDVGLAPRGPRGEWTYQVKLANGQKLVYTEEFLR